MGYLYNISINYQEKTFMTIEFKALIPEEISLKNNHLNISPDTRVQIKSQFSCNLKRNLNNNPNLSAITLSFLSLSSEQEPAPFDVRVTYVGFFEGSIADKEEERQFVIEGTKIIYPYLRSAVSGLTTSANAPIMLPLSCPISFAPAEAPAQSNGDAQKSQYVFAVDDKLN